MRHTICIPIITLFVLNAVTSARAEEATAKKPRPVVPSVKIETPTKNQTVGGEGTASGTCNPPDLDHIWVFVWPRFSPDLAFPQSREATHLTCNDGRWKMDVVFQGPPQYFEVTVHVGTPAASEVLERYLVSGARANGYPGKRLPHGLTRKASVQVIKKK